jgi:hypothetical protein
LRFRKKKKLEFERSQSAQLAVAKAKAGHQTGRLNRISRKYWSYVGNSADISSLLSQLLHSTKECRENPAFGLIKIGKDYLVETGLQSSKNSDIEIKHNKKTAPT